MKAIETFVMKKRDPDEQAAALLERWEAISEYIRENIPEARRITWSCQERKWVYVLFAEITWRLDER